MPRIGPLLEWSREHHSSLVMARDARRAAANPEDAGAISATLVRVASHWSTLLSGHFEQEEQLIRSMENALDPEAVARILAEHAELRRLAEGRSPLQEGLSRPPLEPAVRLARFADLLAAHVRYEERVFFPQVQLHVDAADSAAAHAPHAPEFDDALPDQPDPAQRDNDP